MEFKYKVFFKRVGQIFQVAIAFFIALNLLTSVVTKAQEEESEITPIVNFTELYVENDAKNSSFFDMLAEAARGNITKLMGNNILAFFTFAGQTIFPEQYVEMSPEVRSEYRNTFGENQSLFEFASGSVDYALESQPTVNVAYALANDWVPGYSENSANSVYAASGYDFLMASNISDLWDMSRQIAYIFFIVIIIAAGFMIMFRNKIGGQMAVTVYNTLPNVILGLILVTFSFAIVGLILNLSALLTNLAHSLLNVNSGEGFYATEFFSAMKYMVTGLAPKDADSWVAAIILGIIPTVLTLLTGGLGALLIFFLLLIILITYIMAFWNVWLALFKAYAGILIDTVAGPIILTLAAFPGNSKMMIAWFNRLMRNALLFPVVFFILNAVFKIAADLDINMTGLADGSLDPNATSVSGGIAGLMEGFLKLMLPLGALYFSANVSKVLEEIFPAQGMQGLTQALQGTQQGFTKIPLFGSLFAGK